MTDAAQKLTTQMTAAVATAVSDPAVPASAAAIPAIVDQLAKLIPQIVNSTNAEPWWKSHVTWGAIVTILGLVLGAFGITLDASKQQMIVTLAVPLAGVAWTLYGRWIAKKPLGS